MKELGREFKRIFDPYFNAPIEIWEYFAQQGEIIEKQKDDILKKNGTVEKYLYFILKGSGGIMLFRNNNYLCLDLCYEGDFFGDYLSFLTGKSTELEVVCFEASTFFRIKKQGFDDLAKTEYGTLICKAASDGLYIQKQTQQIDLLTKTAEQRYVEMLENQPNIVHRTPNKHIASYLGITPESFSRIRKKIM
ncbi:MAG: cyclic nucleotide-binding domain-containing protein [Arcicella sp.]|jgi:signal-transduction protein with cAMP-binding, CBS, and nucleotidyltransferase domain|nr:cyclic nucleotide-binding domain-containing protein [Arcicella sp.]